MEEEGIGLVLARATELRMKISNCIHKATTTPHKLQDNPPPGNKNGLPREDEPFGGQDEDEDEEAHRLLNICDALESLETQLSNLQNLQQQQLYERGVALAEIEQSRKMLLDKLMEYKGEELAVINEASAFAGETVEHNNDLLLPPYPSRPPNPLRLENGYLSHFHSSQKRNGHISSDQSNEAKENLSESEQNGSKNPRGIGCFLGAAAKTVFTVVGVVSILSLSGFGPNFVKKGTRFKVLGLFQQQANEERRLKIKCPTGKILVMENGEARCLVKERVEVPFSSAIAKPDVNYGCG
uniref:plastid division protein PDV2-like isoform X1 n=1 Tax=Ziziphus jujuba TaxID=326968 RepID=A0A6P4AUJ5_ZIZJJ